MLTFFTNKKLKQQYEAETEQMQEDYLCIRCTIIVKTIIEHELSHSLGLWCKVWYAFKK